MSAEDHPAHGDSIHAPEDATLLSDPETLTETTSDAPTGADAIARFAKVVPFIAAAFSAYALRIPFLPWLWNGAGLDFFIPVASPVYRQGEHWQASASRIAIVMHTLCGSVMFLLAAIQFDKPLRRAHPSFHRWSGRGYVLFGFLCVGSLQALQDKVGAGSTDSKSQALAVFVNVTSVCWVCATTVAVGAACSRHFELHRDCMALSFILAAVPIAQRALSWFLCAPLAITLRIWICAFKDDESYSLLPPMHRVRWGVPAEQLWGGDCFAEEPAIWREDNRGQPLIFSVDGYGEGEQVGFALSAWLGFGLMAVWGLSPWWQRLLSLSSASVLSRICPSVVNAESLHTKMSRDLAHLAQFKIGNAEMMVPFRHVVENVKTAWAEDSIIQRSRQTIGDRLTMVLYGIIGLIALVAGVAGAAVSIVVATFLVTLIVVVFMLFVSACILLPILFVIKMFNFRSLNE